MANSPHTLLIYMVSWKAINCPFSLKSIKCAPVISPEQQRTDVEPGFKRTRSTSKPSHQGKCPAGCRIRILHAGD